MRLGYADERRLRAPILNGLHACCHQSRRMQRHLDETRWAPPQTWASRAYTVRCLVNGLEDASDGPIAASTPDDVTQMCGSIAEWRRLQTTIDTEAEYRDYLADMATAADSLRYYRAPRSSMLLLVVPSRSAATLLLECTKVCTTSP